MARFGEKLKVEWSNSQLIPTLLLSIYSGRWVAFRGGKENPHRHIVDKSRWGRARRVHSMSTPTSCFTNANPMPRKRKPPLTSPAPKVSEGKLGWVEYVLPQHTLPLNTLP
jgi:hypothetical protein